MAEGFSKTIPSSLLLSGAPKIPVKPRLRGDSESKGSDRRSESKVDSQVQLQRKCQDDTSLQRMVGRRFEKIVHGAERGLRIFGDMVAQDPFVKQIGGMVRGKATSKPETHKDFETYCKVIEQQLYDVNNQLQAEMLSEDNIRQIHDASMFLQQKNVSLSVFGRHNCGKSTLLNALMGDNYLPVKIVNATSMKVEIQHDDTVHTGYCGSHCNGKKNEVSCPHLMIDKSSYRGPDSIHKTLEMLNKEIRDKKEANPQAVQPLLKVNIPIIAQKLHADWRVSLADNPGFGEYHEAVTATAGRSLQTSAAYIVLVQAGDIRDTEIISTFQNIAKCDKDAFSDRLIIVIPKIDHALEDGDLSLSELKLIVWQCVRELVPEANVLDKENVLPMCCKWALEGTQLQHRWQHYQTQCDSSIDKYDNLLKTVRKSARTALEVLHDTGGQEEDAGDKVKLMDENKLIQLLDNGSGIRDLQTRLQRLVSTCIEIWVSKAYSNYDQILQNVLNKLCQMTTQVEKIISNQRKTLASLSGDIEQVHNLRKQILATTTEIKISDSKICHEMDKTFPVDIKMSKAQSEGKKIIKVKIDQFKTECKEKINAKEPFGPEELEADLTSFLKKCEAELDKTFNECCEFPSVVDVAKKHLSNSLSLLDELRNKTVMLCYKENPSSGTRSVLRSGDFELKLAPNLGDIKSQVDSHIPRLAFSLRERIRYALRSTGVWLKNLFVDVDEREEVPKMQGEIIEEYTNISELKKTFDNAKELMEELSNKYLEDIRPHAVMYLYKKHYCEHLLERISVYDKEFTPHLQQVKEAIAKIKAEIKMLKSRIKLLRKNTTDFHEAKKLLKSLSEDRIAKCHD